MSTKINHRLRHHKYYGNDLWTTFQRVQEKLIEGGLPGKSTTGKNTRARAVNGIDVDIKFNRALWLIADELKSRVK